MIKFWFKRQPSSTAKTAPPRHKTTAVAPGADFRAVSVQPGGACCAAARDLAGARLLMRSMPRLPLPDCSIPDTCTCRFRKIADRRAGDRRLLGGMAVSRWYGGQENRHAASRRMADRQPR